MDGWREGGKVETYRLFVSRSTQYPPILPPLVRLKCMGNALSVPVDHIIKRGWLDELS
jgi:hypothetical protein